MEVVSVLMSTYNGEKFLEEQLESLFNQKGVNIQLLVRDDGSTDKTLDILNKYQNCGKLKWYSGENLKPAYSFLNLLLNAPKSDYYAFCDQDDVWLDNKIIKAINTLKELEEKNSEVPCLYCSDYYLVDEALNPLPDNGHFSTENFYSALVVSNATGCTMVFNKRLLEYAKKYIPKAIVMHDDWLHKVCLAVGGKVQFDNYKSLYYRQHSSNVDGGVRTLKDKYKSFFSRWKVKDRIRSQQLTEIFKGFNDEIPKEYKSTLKLFINYNVKFRNRIKIIKNKKLNTGRSLVDFKFKISVLLKYF